MAGKGRERKTARGHEEILGVINMFTILIVMRVSQCIHVKTYQIALNMCGLLYINYTFIKLIFKKEKKKLFERHGAWKNSSKYRSHHHLEKPNEILW